MAGKPRLLLSALTSLLILAVRAAGGPIPLPDSAAAAHSYAARIDVRFSTSYNSNVLQYSAEDQRDFLAWTAADRFAIRSIDDAAYRGSATASISRPDTLHLPFRASYTFVRNAMELDRAADWYSHSASFQQSLGRGVWATGSIYRLPRLFLRYLTDVDLTGPYRFEPRYRPAYLSTTRVRLEAGFHPREDLAVSGRIGRGWQGYNPEFRERRAAVWELDGEGTWGGEAGASVGIEASYVRKRADGTDPAHPAVPDSLREDTSYNQTGAALTLDLPSRGLLRIPASLEIGVGYQHRVFTTSRALDPIHHGRRDRDLTLQASVEKQVQKGLAIFFSWRFENQTSSGPGGEALRRDVSTFRQTVIGGGFHLSWSGRFL